MTLLDYANWVPLPAPVTTGTTVQSFTDPTGEVWIAKNGVNGGAWSRARDVLRARMYRSAAYTSVASTATRIPYDTVTYDPYGMATVAAAAGTQCFTIPVAGLYRLTSQTHIQGAATAGRSYAQRNGTGTVDVTSSVVFDIIQPANSQLVISGSEESLYGAATTWIQYFTAVAQPFFVGPGDTWASILYVGTG